MAEGENGGAFLRPNAAEQAKLRGKVEERARAKKAKSKTEAAERKRQRDADKERIANIEQELAAKRAKREDEAEKTQTPFQKAATAARQSSREDAQRDEVCNGYLDGDEMLGRSSFADKDLVKTLCGDGARVFNQERKMWGTTSHEYLDQAHEQPPLDPLWRSRGVARAPPRARDRAHRGAASQGRSHQYGQARGGDDRLARGGGAPRRRARARAAQCHASGVVHRSNGGGDVQN